MTHDEIKAMAKQAGGTPYTNRHFPGKLAVAFSGEALIEFVRLARESALEEAANVAEAGFKYAKDGYQIADDIRGLKNE